MAEGLDFAFDGGEEPLFADDLDDFGDDISNLPPQMPSLAELSAEQARATAIRGLGPLPGQTVVPGFAPGDGTSTNQMGNAAIDDGGPPLKKKKPILTLKIDRIFSDKGLKYIHTEFPKLKFKGKRHELSDLKHLMRHYEQWANMLYPKMTFSDVTDRIEALAKKREFKTNLIRMRRRQTRGGADSPPLSDTEDLDNHSPNTHSSTGENTHSSTGENTHSSTGENTHLPSPSDNQLLPTSQDNTASLLDHSPSCTLDANPTNNTEFDFDF